MISVPDSATAAAIGYARRPAPYGEGLIKNRYIGRTFIEPNDRLRQAGVALKFNTLPQVLEGRRLVVVDDSIVRGNTSGPIIDLLRRAGASEVHMRVSSPPIKHPCLMGVDMASYKELIAHRLTVEEIRQKIGADTLGYLGLDNMISAVRRPMGEFCLSCFTGGYPWMATRPTTRGTWRLSQQLSAGRADDREGARGWLGGREHVLVWALSHSPRVREVHVAPGNGGTASWPPTWISVRRTSPAWRRTPGKSGLTW